MRGNRLPETWRGGEVMKKFVVALDDEFHADLKELARRRQTTMANLVRYAVDKIFEDELDTISGERGYEEMLADPSSTMPLDEYLKSRGIELSRSPRVEEE